ncbi:DNA alkylation repair protein [Paenibacillus albiflavus]|uniref:DNA alkylation repair protein n=2 Tax=Paenibacillus albiflavus TaxID=2545760 RepID=A0A4R4DZ45_9BACL|nr:DNA alkylation repair protein [Paenibacillus albiflavus]
MAKYMKNLFPYLGIKTPEREALFRGFTKVHGLPDVTELDKIVRELWLLPEREYAYIAMNLLNKRLKLLGSEQADLLEYLIVTRSWWDTVDLLAGQVAGSLFTRYPELIDRYAESWIVADNMWLQRAAILFQLKYKNRTDEERLFRYIKHCLSSKEFFIQKSIGWALREYAKTEPERVRQFVAETPLPALSKREALKHL